MNRVCETCKYWKLRKNKICTCHKCSSTKSAYRGIDTLSGESCMFWESKPYVPKLTVAFRSLRKLGYFARQNWQCCQGCGGAAIPYYKSRYVYYHAQDKEELVETGSCYLAWNGDAVEICAVLGSAGLITEWDGKKETRIQVTDPDFVKVNK